MDIMVGRPGQGGANPRRNEAPSGFAADRDREARLVVRTGIAMILSLRSTLTISTLTVSTLALLAACTNPPAEDEGGSESSTDTGDTGDLTSCADPGSEVLPDIKPVLEPNPQQSPDYTCTNGWATDAPMRDAAWTVEVGSPVIAYYSYSTWVEAHPEGGVMVAGGGLLARYSADGEELWAADVATSDETQHVLAVEPSGSVVLATYDSFNNATQVNRYAADGTLIGPVAIPWNGNSASVWGIEPFGDDLLFAAYDEDDQGIYESTLLRVDPNGNVVLRKSTNQTSGGAIFAVNDAGTVVFGQFPTFLVALEDGAVLGNFAPSNGFPSAVIGVGDDFLMTGNNGDLILGSYSDAGAEQWLQAYDRATLSDQGMAVAVGDDGTIVTGGSTTTLNFSNSYWFGTQPIVIVSDADGNALWADRLAGHGFTSSVAIGTQGEVYATGIVELDFDPNGEPVVTRFLRGYAP
jgi:hypothetical protein